MACLSTSSSNDKLAFDVGLQEQSQGKQIYRIFIIFTLSKTSFGALIYLERRGLLVDTSPGFKTAFGRWKGSSRWRFDFSFSRHWALPGKYSSAKSCLILSVFRLLLLLTLAHHKRERCIDCQRFFPCDPLVGGSFWNRIESRQKRWYVIIVIRILSIATNKHWRNETFFSLKGFLFGGEVLRFFHGGDECLTIPSSWSEQPGQKSV